MLIISKYIGYQVNAGTASVILFIAMYIGIVFLIASAAVLAIQQLSQCNESLDRYKALEKMGASSSQINKSILIEVCTFFTLPLILAIVHSIVGIKTVDNLLKVSTEFDIFFPAIVTALIFIVVYGGYFYSTYLGYKNVISPFTK